MNFSLHANSQQNRLFLLRALWVSASIESQGRPVSLVLMATVFLNH